MSVKGMAIERGAYWRDKGGRAPKGLGPGGQSHRKS